MVCWLPQHPELNANERFMLAKVGLSNIPYSEQYFKDVMLSITGVDAVDLRTSMNSIFNLPGGRGRAA
jgi:hypothetical protein